MLAYPPMKRDWRLRARAQRRGTAKGGILGRDPETDQGCPGSAWMNCGPEDPRLRAEIGELGGAIRTASALWRLQQQARTSLTNKSAAARAWDNRNRATGAQRADVLDVLKGSDPFTKSEPRDFSRGRLDG